ncbi:riboflavin synthase [Megasphaera vaginalis (ex Srinivasan et al. 2021)]|uniref:Riboflavin synthase n=1 Tax=Megasphaera vaginalis (ex Srinivasan et al. 2021) TaxID=1111454 RepID=U7UMZ7_9FIRM|nr:riboflavin synthase [Megasphaera vaginalis (ex Srinivasan et al. 2021)]ERT60279.1 riboflavin synthase, alpha subunit [Megasphaera vaginalis (ex Srinivasan et al. 2021)]
MFTGIIEELGTVGAMDRKADSIRLTVEAKKVLEGTQIGDSIAVNGVCLTVTTMTASSFTADVMHETMRRSSLRDIRSGSQVNLERALQLGSRLGGHIVSGHIDSMGRIQRIATDGIARVLTIAIEKELSPFIVEKGSIAIDGISLTVAAVSAEAFTVSVIPHTMANTTLLTKKVGAVVNLETDMIGKYVHNFTADYTARGKGKLSLQSLLENGF